MNNKVAIFMIAIIQLAMSIPLEQEKDSAVKIWKNQLLEMENLDGSISENKAKGTLCQYKELLNLGALAIYMQYCLCGDFYTSSSPNCSLGVGCRGKDGEFYCNQNYWYKCC